MFLAAGDRGFCHTQDLSNGYVVVVEKEEKNSPDDMGTINIWAEKSSRVADARLKKRPLQSTSKPSTAAQDTNIQEADERTVITHFDAAKIRKDAETVIQNDEKLREMRVYHGSGADFDAFDHSYMGEDGESNYVIFNEDDLKNGEKTLFPANFVTEHRCHHEIHKI